jgi:hypothetical protein
LYDASPKQYPRILPEISYSDDAAIRWVKSQGDISWKDRHIYLSTTLAGEGWHAFAEGISMLKPEQHAYSVSPKKSMPPL